MSSVRTRAWRRATPHAALAGLVVVAWVVLSALVLGSPGPRVFPDELIYMDATAELAAANRPSVRGESYGYGPVYPTLIAPLLALAPDREVGFVLVQLFNALAFALVAVPAFLLARLVMRPWPALLAAALSVAVPSSVYAAGVLTESLAYLSFAVVLLLIARTVVSPTTGTQLGAIAAVALAAGVRTQFAVLAGVLVAVLALARLTLPRDARTHLRVLWPTAAAVLIGALVLAGALLSGRSPADLLGSYGVLWTSYDPGDVARWTVDHGALLTVYVGVIPVVVAPVVAGRWYRSARAGGRPEAALVALLAVVTLAMLLVVGLFATTSYAQGVLHDRSIFYLAPLWMTVLCAWLDAGLPRPASALAVGGAVAFTLVVVLPYDVASTAIPWETLAFEPWQFVERGNPTGAPFSGREALVLFAALGVLAAVAVPRASRWVIVAVVASFLGFTASLSWAHAHEGARSADARAFGAVDVRPWLDEATGGQAVLVTIASRCAGDADEAAYRLTEFYNGAVGEVAAVGEPDPLGPPATEVALVPLGGVTTVVLADGSPLVAGVVVAPAGAPVRGRVIGEGTRVPLVAWQVDGRVVFDVGSQEELERRLCASAGS